MATHHGYVCDDIDSIIMLIKYQYLLYRSEQLPSISLLSVRFKYMKSCNTAEMIAEAYHIEY